MSFIRVKCRDTGHEFSVVNVDPDVHIVLDKPGQDQFGRQLPAKHNTTKGAAAPARPDTESGSTPEKKEAQK
jgi:hypothetical protein